MTWILPKQLHTSASALDTEALSLDLNEQSQVCAQSLFVRSKPSQLRIWSAKWKRDSWTRHLSGRILRPSLGQRFATEWTSSLGATHASPSAQPANAKVSKTRGIFGRLLQMAFDFSNPSAASLRTSKDISAWGCPTSSKTWQEWVIERRGAYSQRLNAVRHTSESGSSSWPSPVASEVRQGFQDRSRGMKGSQESLTTVVVKSWPTPAARDHKDAGDNVDMEKVAAKSKLSGVVAMHGPLVPASSSTDGSRPGLWQTATVSTGAHKQKDGSMTDKLDQQVKSWATPRAGKTTDENPETWALRQAKGDVATMPLTAQVKSWATARSGMARGNNFTYDRGKGNIEEQAGASVQGGGKLNPRWVETLMGLPVGWTMPSCASPVTIERMNSDYSVTVLSQQQQNERSEC